ncbi:MAG TPA: metallophosphoesterase [Planctomycetota bacterium]|nr:metallophosphoesterase [Planctomycetota bacterium]
MRPAFVGTVASLLLAAGCSGKPPPPLPRFDFVAYGDCRHNVAVHQELVDTLRRTQPKYVLVTGDLVDQPDRPEDWQAWRDVTRELRASSDYLSAVGDHDWEKVDTFLSEFHLERWYYDRRIGEVHVFLLDSRNFHDPVQMEWLRKTAGASNARHKFAVFHHPPFMIDQKRGREADALRPLIHPLLVELKFCAAFCGHQHGFYTTLRDGVRYVVTAGGGAPLWRTDPALGIAGDRSKRFYHFVGLTDLGKRIEARVLEKDGTEAEELRFTLCEH